MKVHFTLHISHFFPKTRENEQNVRETNENPDGGRLMKEPFIQAGRIVNTHGVRGEVRIEVWLDSPAYLKTFPRIFVDGEEKRILSAFVHKQFLVALLEGVSDVNAAMLLKGKTVTVARTDARLPKGGYFLQDLIGAEVRSEDGISVGTLTEILEKPASDVYVVTDAEGKEHLIPAVPAFVLSADADAGVVTVRMIEGM